AGHDRARGGIDFVRHLEYPSPVPHGSTRGGGAELIRLGRVAFLLCAHRAHAGPPKLGDIPSDPYRGLFTFSARRALRALNVNSPRLFSVTNSLTTWSW